MKLSDWITKEWFTAHYNPNTDRIEGCSYGSMLYYHEDRHRQQFQDNMVKQINHISNQLTFFGVLLYPIILYMHYFGGHSLLWLPLLIFIPDIFMTVYLEVDAFIYQIKMVTK